MLLLTAKHRVFLAINPMDFRKRLSGTLAVCRQQWQCYPDCGHVFVFRNRRGTTIRCILYDNGGYWLMEKRISKGRFLAWPQSPYDTCELTLSQLHWLLDNPTSKALPIH